MVNMIQHDDNMDGGEPNELQRCPSREGIISGEQGATLQPQEQKQTVLEVVCCQLDFELGKAVARRATKQ